MYTTDSVDGKLNIPAKLLWNDVKIGFFFFNGERRLIAKTIVFHSKRKSCDRSVSKPRQNEFFRNLMNGCCWEQHNSCLFKMFYFILYIWYLKNLVLKNLIHKTCCVNEILLKLEFFIWLTCWHLHGYLQVSMLSNIIGLYLFLT